MNRSFAERLRRGDLLLGTIVTLQSTDVSELLSMAGYDWLFIDTEHAPLTLRDAQTLIQASRVPCLIRVADDAEATIKKALDTGATGIVVPQVTTAEQAERVVRHAKYPPAGTRGVGIVRAQGYGHSMREYLYQANEETVVVVQVEHKIGVENIYDITAVPGVDAVFVGPYDLSASLDLTGLVTNPGVTAAIDRVTEACKENKCQLGIYCGTAELAQSYIAQGYSLVAVGMDTIMLGAAARQALGVLRP
ncbi:MAG: aldolase/citrate lyase family protein [Betaproteobacteria bacterium]|nr:aldolase/citrate lyase family protein [Pseudomonadota bacterium]